MSDLGPISALAADGPAPHPVKPRDITVQTGESDNILVAMDSYRTHEDVQVFPHPAQSPDEPRSYFGLLSIKKFVDFCRHARFTYLFN